MKLEFHLAIFAIAFNIANSVPYGLVRRLGAGFESIVVYAVPTSPAVSDQSYSSSSIDQNYYSPSSSSSYYSPSSSPSYSSPSSDPIDIPYNTATICRHGITLTSERNHRQREQMTYQPVVRETFRSRNNSPYSSYGNEKTAYPTPNYSVRDSFESSHRQKKYGRDNSRASQTPMVCTPQLSNSVCKRTPYSLKESKTFQENRFKRFWTLLYETGILARATKQFGPLYNWRHFLFSYLPWFPIHSTGKPVRRTRPSRSTK